MLAFAIVVVLALVLLNGLFAMTELAVVSSRKSKLHSRAERGDRGARAALKLAEDPTHFLSAVQVGITLVGILAAAYGQAAIGGEQVERRPFSTRDAYPGCGGNLSCRRGSSRPFRAGRAGCLKNVLRRRRDRLGRGLLGTAAQQCGADEWKDVPQ